MSAGSDFDIFLVPSFRDITRMAGPEIIGSVMGKNSSPKPLFGDPFGEIVVELLGDVAGQFEMLLLVLADRHMGRLVQQDVGRHQRGIGEQARARTFSAFLPAFSFHCVMRCIQPMRATQLKIQASSACCTHLGLVEDDRLFRIEPGGEIGRGQFQRRALQIVRVLPDGDRVHVDDAIDAVMGVLQRHEAAGWRRDNCRGADRRRAGCRKRRAA